MKSHWYETNVVFDEEKATLFLARGMQNRPINHAQLKRLDEQEVIYACANTIKVDWNGRTIDGQHRLQWVKTRKKTVRFDVLWDAPPELAKVIERHVERVVVLRRFTGMFGALRGRSSPQGAKVTGLLVTFHARPDRHTRAATSTRLRASQRVEMLARWVLTVLSDKNNWSAISLLVSPCATN